MSKFKSVDIEVISENLYRVTRKMSGLAWLTECQGHFKEIPENPEETMLGISLIIRDLRDEIYRAAEQLEQTPLKTMS